MAIQGISNGATALPAGAATEVTLANIDGKVPPLGQATSAESVPVVVAADQSTIPVSVSSITGPSTVTADQGTAGASPWPVGDGGGSLTVDTPQLPAALSAGRLVTDGSQVTQPVSDAGGSLTVDSLQLPAALVGGRLPVDGSGVTQPVSDGGGSLTVDSPQLPAALVGGRFDENVGSWLGSTAPTVGQKAASASIPITLATEHQAAGTPVAVRQSDGAAFFQAAKEHTGAADYHAARLTDGAAFYKPTTPSDTQPVSDAGGSLTVDGTVTANQGTAGASPWPVSDGSGSLTVDSPQLPAALVGGRLSVDGSGVTQPVSLAGSVTVVQPTAASLNAQVQGPAALGAAIVGNPVLTAGSDGTNVQALATDAFGVGYYSPGYVAVILGRRPGTAGTISGRVGTAALTEVAIRASTYVEQSSGAQRSISSSSASDAAAGTGARTIAIVYYTLSAGVVTGPFTEVVTLNGTTPVNTVATNIALVDSMYIVTVGSGGVSAGNISLFGTTAGGGGAIALLALGKRSTEYAHHYVPSGKTCLLEGAAISSSAPSGEIPAFTTRILSYSTANAAEREFVTNAVVTGSGGTNSLRFPVPRAVTGPARILFYVTPNTTKVETHFVEAFFWEV